MSKIITGEQIIEFVDGTEMSINFSEQDVSVVKKSKIASGKPVYFLKINDGEKQIPESVANKLINGKVCFSDETIEEE